MSSEQDHSATHNASVQDAPSNFQTVEWSNRPMHQVRDEIFSAIRGDGTPEIFQQGARLVRVRPDEDRVFAETLTIDGLRHHLDKSAYFISGSSEKYKRIGPPPIDFVRDILAMPSWPKDVFPPLKSICRVPYFRKDGSLVQTRGYDTTTQVWLDITEDLRDVNVPSKPTLEQVIESIELIVEDLLADFPFETDSDKANAIAFLISPFIRELSGGLVPMLLADAPVQGTGKGLLINTLAVVATGQQVAATPETKCEEEVRKAITAALAEGRSWHMWDNLTGRLRSPSLASLLTTRKWSDRELGKTNMLHLENHTIWSATANNLEVDADLARRIVWVRLDARMEYPDKRPPEQFQHPDILQWAASNRAELVTAILTIVRGWVIEGQKAGDKCMGSFENWAKTVSGILFSAGINGFLENSDARRKSGDEDSADMKLFVRRWWEKHGDETLGVSRLYDIVDSETIFPYVTAADTPTARRQRLGHLLRKNEGRQFDGYRICSKEVDHCGRRQYALASAAPPPVQQPHESIDSQRSRDFQKLLSAWFFGDPPYSVKRVVEFHLNECPEEAEQAYLDTTASEDVDEDDEIGELSA